jgi:hypothetical protein
MYKWTSHLPKKIAGEMCWIAFPMEIEPSAVEHDPIPQLFE